MPVLAAFLKVLCLALLALISPMAAAAPPTCTLTATPPSVPAGAPVNLLAACSPVPASYIWTNTGFSSTEFSGTVNPSVTTTYSVIGVNADGRSDTASVTVVATGTLVPPTCTLTASTNNTAPGTAVILTTNCNPTATSWTWADGIMASNASVGTVYPKITTTYTVRGSNAAGMGPPVSLTVNVIVPIVIAPVCALTASPDYVVAGGPSVLTATCSPAAASYVWTNTNFGSTAASGTVRPAATTTYSVRGVNEVGTGNMVSATVTVSDTPGSCTAGLIWNGSACVCPAGQSFVDGQCFAPLAAGSCGVERWAIKTGTDAAAAGINTSAVVPSSVSTLSALNLAANSGASRQSPLESTVYVVDATLTRYAMADDSDYQLVLSAGGKTMMAKLPHPDCVGAQSPFAAAMASARATFNSQLRTTRAFKSASIPVRITGIGYFEANRGQTGAAANGAELHPVLKIEFSPANPQGSDPAYPLASHADRLFNWAEAAYPSLFPRPGSAGVYLQYGYRYYAGTGNYLATDPNGRVILHNGREWNLLDVGSVADLLPGAVQAGY